MATYRFSITWKLGLKGRELSVWTAPSRMRCADLILLYEAGKGRRAEGVRDDRPCRDRRDPLGRRRRGPLGMDRVAERTQPAGLLGGKEGRRFLGDGTVRD